MCRDWWKCVRMYEEMYLGAPEDAQRTRSCTRMHRRCRKDAREIMRWDAEGMYLGLSGCRKVALHMHEG